MYIAWTRTFGCGLIPLFRGIHPAPILRAGGGHRKRVPPAPRLTGGVKDALSGLSVYGSISEVSLADA